jgi:WD40 repeat protein
MCENNMRKLNLFFLLFAVVVVLISSCNSNAPYAAQTSVNDQPEQEKPTVTLTSLPEPTFTKDPTSTPTINPTNTIPPSNEPGLIVTFGEEIHGPWSWGRAVFSPDGQIIAHASARIRLWNVNTHSMIYELNNPYADDCAIAEAQFSPNGKYFAVSNNSCWNEENRTGHLVVWDMTTYNIIQDWVQEDAHMPGTGDDHDGYLIPVDAMTFLPNSTGIVFASGNTLQIKDILDDNKSDVLELGDKMYATQLSTSSDGRLAYVLMRWTKDYDWPSLWTEQHKVQVWNINSHAMINEIKYPEGWATMDLEFLGTRLAQIDFENATSQILNLETGAVQNLPFRLGGRYYNLDGSLVLYSRLLSVPENEQSMELWKTDTWQNLYTFIPEFGTDWIYGLHDITFSPDNRILAIEHGEQVSLWNISPVTQP